MIKRSLLYSVLFLKCPQCRQGDFLESNPYHVSDFNKVKEHCPTCDLKYSIEPSFYYGSMYISYAVGVALAVTIYVLLWLAGYGDSPLVAFIAILVGLILLFPYIGAVSKSIWAHLFFKFDPKLAKKVSHDSRT